MLDSFPSIFTPPSRYRDRIAIHTSLSTSTRIGARIKDLRTIVSQAMPSHQRESVSSTLSELIEAYEEGWEEDSSDEDD